MKLHKWEEEIFFSTVRITIEDSHGEDLSVGTGFIMGVPITNEKGDDKDTVVLVSCRHVFEEANKPISLKFHQAKPDKSGPQLGSTPIPLTENFGDHYLPHPNPKIDLACIGAVGLRFRDDIFFRYVGPGILADLTEDDIYAGKEVLFVGYPDGQYDWSHNLPIMRFGHIATVPSVDFRGEQAFLIDAPVFEGSSGSAVFSIIDGKYRLVGVVTDTLFKEDKDRSSGLNISYRHYLHLGLVLKSTLIYELLEHLVKEQFPGFSLGVPR
ncbi:MAG: serine protease [Rhodothermales bacterium]